MPFEGNPLGPGPGGETPFTALPGESGRNFTWTLTAGIAIAVGGRIHLNLSYRYTDAGAIWADAGDVATLGYREDGARREIPVRINETSANHRTHLVFAALRFEFRLLGGCEPVPRRHAPPARVPALKNSTFESMTRPVFVAREPAGRSNPQSTETPHGPGNPSSDCDPMPNPTRQLPRLSGLDTR